MRGRLLAVLTACLLAGSSALSGARADEPRLKPDGAAPPAAGKPADGKPAAPSRALTLDDLFGRLKAAKDDVEATGIANLIERRLQRSGSDTADLLMARAGEALKADDAALAIELLDRVTTLEPNWAVAWYRRAAAFSQLDDPASAMADLHQALAHEPRLFEAWSSLGAIYLGSGDDSRALQAFRRAIAIHPHLETVRKQIDRLAPTVDGRDL